MVYIYYHKMSREVFSMLGADSNEKLVFHESSTLNQSGMFNSELTSELYDVLYFNKQGNGNMGSENSAVETDGRYSLNVLHECGAENAALSGIQDINFLPESVRSISEQISPVTHIEIIKSGSRRVTGANRVVPLLTSGLKTGKLAFTVNKLAEVYKDFVSDLGNSDSNKTCMLCHKVFLSCTDLEYHVRNIHAMDVAADQCFVCRKKYVFQEQLRIHLRQTHSINCPDLICKICFMEFSTTIEQKAHERKHDESHLCHICNKKFSFEYLYQKHFNQHIFQAKPNECKKCGKRFKNDIALNIHKKRHVNVVCASCKMHFPHDIDLLFHIQGHKTDDVLKLLKNVEHMDQEECQLEDMLTLYAKLTLKIKINSHNELENNTQENSIVDCINTMVSTVSQFNGSDVRNKKGAACRLCGINVSSEKELLDHRRHFHLRNRTCPFCGKRNRSVSQTWRHMHTHLLKNKVNISKLPVESHKDLMSYPGCNKEGHEVSSYMKTKQPRKNARLYSCTICSRKFLYPGSRDNHMLQHSKDKCDSWKCSVCGQVFPQPRLLLAHVSTHEPSMNCQFCEKPFVSQNALQLHLKTHFSAEGKKMFKCNMCPIECPTLTGLKAHRRCHTGERPYTCGQCHRRFKRRQAVKKHIQVVHNSDSLLYHKCSHCPRMFNSSGNLIRHYLRVHCQVRRFICGVCGSRFSQNQDLRRHFKVSHEIEMPNINGSDRKALKEIYVIPDIDDLSETNPHALKIKAIVAEEKAKFSKLSELLVNKGVRKEDTSTETDIQLIHNFPYGVDSILQTSIDEDAAAKEDQKNANSEFMEMRILSGKHYDSGKRYVTNSGENCNGKLDLCEYCNKNFPGANEYREHVAEPCKSYVCKHCGSSFYAKEFAEEHFSSEHNVMECISVNDMNGEGNYLKHIQNVDDVQVIHSMSDIPHELPAESSHVDKRTTSATGQELAVLSDVAAGTSNFTTRDSIGSTVISERSLPVASDSSSNNNISTTLSINGIILQNVIIQQTPTVLQSVPLGFPNQGIVNATNSITPVVTFNSPSVTPVDNHTSFFNVNDHNVTMSSCVDPSDSLTAPEGVLGSANQEILSQVVTNGPISEMKNSGNEGQEIHSISEGLKQKNVFDKPTACDTDKKGDELKESKKVKCKYCGEVFYNASSLNCHLKSHSGSKQYGCPDCGKRFSEKHNLKIHMMTHTGERPYQCEDCGKQLRYRKDVLDHKRMHLGEKPFVCEECGRKFIRQRELNRHKVIHTGEKKHECPICGKTFGRLDQLRHAHLPTHSNNLQPMHTCNICNKSYRLKSKLRQHEKLHSGLKPYKCELCKKSFALDVYLKAHMRCHKKRHSYVQCPKCPRRFISEATLQVHERTFHARLKKGLKQTELANEGTFMSEDGALLQSENVGIEKGLETDIEILHDVDLSLLDTSNCNAVIFLQMAPEELKLPLGVDN